MAKIPAQCPNPECRCQLKDSPIIRIGSFGRELRIQRSNSRLCPCSP
jgi:hypothetical protein